MTLVAYFSPSGTTKRIAEILAKEADASLYEIVPETPYTTEDLDWNNDYARSTVEMKDLDFRPAMADTTAPVDTHDTILVGFPIWWYREPSIIDSFLDAYDFTGKTVIPFCTSGGSSARDATERMRGLLGEGVNVLDGAHFPASVDEDTIENWCEEMGLDD